MWGFLPGCRGTSTSDRADSARTGGEDPGKPQSPLLGSEVPDRTEAKLHAVCQALFWVLETAVELTLG